MISVSDFRNGVTFDMDGKVMQIIEFQHVKPGKGAAFVRVKMRNVITGGVTETTFNPNDKYPTAYIERRKMDYSYNDGDLYYFMDNETYEMTPVNADRTLSIWKSPRPSRVSQATPQPTPSSLRPSKPARRSAFLSLSMKATEFPLTRVPASILAAPRADRTPTERSTT